MDVRDVEFELERAVRTLARPIVQESTLLKGMRQETGRAVRARDVALTAWEHHAGAAMTMAKVSRLPAAQRLALLAVLDRLHRVNAYRALPHELAPYVGQYQIQAGLLGELVCWYCGEKYQVTDKDRKMTGKELASRFGLSQSTVHTLKKRVYEQMDRWLGMAIERMGWMMEGGDTETPICTPEKKPL